MVKLSFLNLSSSKGSYLARFGMGCFEDLDTKAARTVEEINKMIKGTRLSEKVFLESVVRKHRNLNTHVHTAHFICRLP